MYFQMHMKRAVQIDHLKDKIMTRKNNTLMGNGLIGLFSKHPTRSSSLFMELEYFKYVTTYLKSRDNCFVS